MDSTGIFIDLWELLARLDACYHVSVQGRYLGEVRHWEVIVRRREGHPGHEVRVRHPSIVPALLEVIRQAESRGWPEE